jgi:hypothetical protein
MNTDINGLIKDDISDAIDRGRSWLEEHYRVWSNFLYSHFDFSKKKNFLVDCRFI